MTTQIMDLRWIAPPGSNVHPRLALVKHGERLFSYSELLVHTPFEHVVASLDEASLTPQEWWDDLVARSPAVANATATKCRSLDFDILDLYAAPVRGTG